ncbi:hypothetical protein N7517_002637 [Penicillium concentricum]|uniref:Uncharacterized protein n=1 Tax=Penicillium concentricum TaxID=293559 RepID=A0A9W9SUG2_9EURO|nr:uncharacterized protein N7517_002637 [Penicillium concentricum]KAJ5384726.1 hypothetical protein N7517_002637 [Penicillium concentricum]
MLDCNIITIDLEAEYQYSAPHRGPSVKSISAKKLDELAKPPSSSDFDFGNLRIIQQLGDGKDTKVYYHMQREIRNKEWIPSTPYFIQQLWFEHYWISQTGLMESSIGRNLLKTEAPKGVREALPEDHAFNYS